MNPPAASTGTGVSAVICTRNRPELLARCLASLAELNPAPLEVIVVDQSEGSESAGVVERFAGRIPSLRRLPTGSRGLSRARNAAIEAARSEILAFTDDDCLVRRDWIGEVIRAFEEDPELAVVTGGSLPDPGDTADPRILAAATWHPAQARLFRRPTDPARVGGGFNLSFRKAWARKVGLFDPDLGPGGRFRGADDTDFIHRILRSGGVIRYEPKVVVSHLPWRTASMQAAVEFEYGHGIAVWALKRLCTGDLYPSWVVLRVLLAQGKCALAGLLRGDEVSVRTGWAYLSGLGRGAAAWCLARNGGGSSSGPAREAAPGA